MTSVIFLKTKDGLISGSDTKTSDADGDYRTPYGVGFSKVGKFNGLRYGHAGNAGIAYIHDIAVCKHKDHYTEMTNGDLYKMIEWVVSQAKRLFGGKPRSKYPMRSTIVFVGISGYVAFEIDNELNFTWYARDWDAVRMKVVALGSGNPSIFRYMRKNYYSGRVTDRELVRRALQSAKSKDSGTGGELIVKDWVEETTEYNKPKKLHFVTWFEIYVWLFNQLKQIAKMKSLKSILGVRILLVDSS